MLYFIVNEKSKSGKGNQVWNQIVDYLESNHVEYRYQMTEYRGHASDIAREISEIDQDHKKLIVVGGDGTINEVINGMTDFERITLGVIPNGSGNDFVRGLGSETNAIKYLEKITNGASEQKIDLGKVWWDDCEEPKLFAISAGIGMDAKVCRLSGTSRVKKYLNRLGLGKLTYLILTIKALFSMETTGGVFTAGRQGADELDDKSSDKGIRETFDRMIFAAMMNFRAEGGGVPMAPYADAQDGMLSMCCAHDVSKWKTFFYLPLLVAARHSGLKVIRMLDSEEIQWKLDKPMDLHTDGEYRGEVTKVKLICLKGQLKVFL